MVSDLARCVERIHPFAEMALDDVVVDGDAELLEKAISQLYELVINTATFISGYVQRHPLGMCRITDDCQLLNFR